MDNLKAGDRIRVTFDGSSDPAMEFTICATLTDPQEGFGPETEDYVACWLEVSQDDCVEGDRRRVISLGTDFKYAIDGRYVTIERIAS